MPKSSMTFATMALMLALGPLGAQGHGRARGRDVPPGQRPPAGLCRIWIDGVPPGHQPAPTDCATAVRTHPPNARIIYGDDARRPNNQMQRRWPWQDDDRWDRRDRDDDDDRRFDANQQRNAKKWKREREERAAAERRREARWSQDDWRREELARARRRAEQSRAMAQQSRTMSGCTYTLPDGRRARVVTQNGRVVQVLAC